MVGVGLPLGVDVVVGWIDCWAILLGGMLMSWRQLVGKAVFMYWSLMKKWRGWERLDVVLNMALSSSWVYSGMQQVCCSADSGSSVVTEGKRSMLSRLHWSSAGLHMAKLMHQSDQQ